MKATRILSWQKTTITTTDLKHKALARTTDNPKHRLVFWNRHLLLGHLLCLMCHWCLVFCGLRCIYMWVQPPLYASENVISWCTDTDTKQKAWGRRLMVMVLVCIYCRSCSKQKHSNMYSYCCTSMKLSQSENMSTLLCLLVGVF